MPSVSLATQAFRNYRDFDEFPPDMQRDARRALTVAAEGGKVTSPSRSRVWRVACSKYEGDRFTLDRMIAILGKLNQDLEVSVSFRPRQPTLRPHLKSICQTVSARLLWVASDCFITCARVVFSSVER